MSDIYASPTSDLMETRPDGRYGSLEKGTAGDYHFSIGETLSEAWQRTRGAKLTINLAYLLYMGIIIGVIGIIAFASTALIAGVAQSMSGADADGGTLATIGTIAAASSIVQQVLIILVTTPLVMGLMMLGVRRSLDLPISATSILGYYTYTLPLFAAYVLMMLLVGLGFIFLIIPGIYLLVAFTLSLTLVVDKKLGPWKALMASRKAIHKRWFAVFGFGFALMFINLLGAIPLGIGLIWTVPMSVIAFGILYRNVFGCEAETCAA